MRTCYLGEGSPAGFFNPLYAVFLNHLKIINDYLAESELKYI